MDNHVYRELLAHRAHIKKLKDFQIAEIKWILAVWLICILRDTRFSLLHLTLNVFIRVRTVITQIKREKLKIKIKQSIQMEISALTCLCEKHAYIVALQSITCNRYGYFTLRRNM